MKLNNLMIPSPRRMNIEPVELSVVARMASGRKVKDVIAIKNNYVLSYQGLKSESFLVFKDAYYSGNSVSFEYEDAEGAKIVYVTVNEMPYSLLKQNPKLSQNVTITLEEV